VSVTSPVTFLSVPGRGNVALAGHADGKVVFFDARNLQLLYEFRPHDHSLTCIFSSTNAAPPSSSSSSSSDRGGGGGQEWRGDPGPRAGPHPGR
jgi:hypothetical protein